MDLTPIARLQHLRQRRQSATLHHRGRTTITPAAVPVPDWGQSVSPPTTPAWGGGSVGDDGRGRRRYVASRSRGRGRALQRRVVLAMIKRRATAAGLPPSTCCHTGFKSRTVSRAHPSSGWPSTRRARGSPPLAAASGPWPGPNEQRSFLRGDRLPRRHNRRGSDKRGVTGTRPSQVPVRGWGYFLAAFFLRSAQ